MTGRITRRELLLGGVTAAASLAAYSRRADSMAGQSRRVVIIGAGLAGLVAAYELKRAGYSPVVLEARTRAGGRVLTLREPFSDGLYAEAGALFIPDNHDLTLRYVRKFGLPLHGVTARGEAEHYFIRGKRIAVKGAGQADWPLELTPEERSLGLNGMWDRYIGATINGFPNPADANWPPASLRPLDGMTATEFLRSRGASKDAAYLLGLGGMDLWGDGPEACSALAILRDLALRRTETKSYAIRGGNDLLPKAFATELTLEIQYGSPVTRIERDSANLRVIYRKSNEERRIEADHVICAIPFSTLRGLEFTPPLSAPKRNAIDQLPYTSVARVFLQSRRRFWRDDGIAGSYATDLPVMWTWEPSIGQGGTRGILESYMAGPQARKITGMPESDRTKTTLAQMEKVYPGLRENFERGVTKCWDEDEWSRGDYCWFKPGQQVSLLPHIARPEGGIHFAGEHASPWPGWMQGALHAGLRAAREIMAS